MRVPLIRVSTPAAIKTMQFFSHRSPAHASADTGHRPWSVYALALTIGVFSVCFLIVGWMTGCQRREAANPSVANAPREDSKSSAKQDTPREVLRRMVAKYRSCSTYSDETSIQLRYQHGEKTTTERTGLKIRFARPNRLSLTVISESNEVQVRANEKTIAARVIDPRSNDFHGQRVEQPTPPRVTVNDVYKITEFSDAARPDHMTSILLGLPISLNFSQLALLVSESPFEKVFPADARIEQVPSQEINGHDCRGIRVAGSEDPSGFVFWIDSKNDALRRIDFPTRDLDRRSFSEEQPTDLRLSADFDRIEFDRSISEDEFVLVKAKNDRLVRYFVVPPPPMPNSRMGNLIGEFELNTLAGQTESTNEWMGKHAVLVWFDDHPTCRAVLAELELVYREFRDDERVIFRAICVDQNSRLSDILIRELMKDWGVTLPVARDTTAAGRDRLGIENAPTLAIIGSNRRLQFFQTEHDSEVDQDIRSLLRGLFAGNDIGGEVLKQYQGEMQRFHQQLTAASVAQSEHVAPLEEPKLVAVAPKKLKIERLWQCSDVASPGNILVTGDEANPVVHVVSRLRDVVILASSGKVSETFSLDLDSEEAITFLKSFVDASGRTHFIAAARQGRHAFVFDESFRRELRYPAESDRSAEIQDIFVSDLDQDNEHEMEIYIAFADPVGLHRVDMKGSRVWSCRSIRGIASMTKHRAGFGRLLVCSESGAIVPVFVDGEPETPMVVHQRTIHQLAAASSDRHRETEFLGMTYNADGRLIAVGLSRDLEEKWSYGLPNGTYFSPVETPISVRLFPGSRYQWVMVGPDGSIHIVDDDGSFFDSFHLGHVVHGIAGYRESNGGVLLISSASTVTAYRVNQ